MRTGRRVTVVASIVAALASLASLTGAEDCPAPAAVGFGPPALVDGSRSGANPVMVRTSDGTLLLTADPSVRRASGEPDSGELTTLSGQAPLWRSRTGGLSWESAGIAAGRGPARPAVGTGEPDLAPDVAGLVYAVEDGPAGAWVTRSDDAGGTWTSGSPVAATMPSRPWLAAERAAVVYLTAGQGARRSLLTSVNSGLTFAKVAEWPGGFSKPVIDAGGALYGSFTRLGPGGQPGTTVALARIPGARASDFTVRTTTIASGLVNLEADATAVDAAGNVYVVWSRPLPSAAQPGGIWYAYSRDSGATFSVPIRLDVNPDDLTVATPAIVAGAAGKVAVAWLQSSRSYRKEDPNSYPYAEWHVRVAVSTDAAGCGSSPPRWTTMEATSTVHRGPICTTMACDLGTGSDSRMGRSLSIAATAEGRIAVAYPDTLLPDRFTGRPSAVAHPAVVVSSSGARLY